MTRPTAPCPCGSGVRDDLCCGRLHRGDGLAATPEELMRSRYTAFVRGEAAYLLATWHPRTRPHDLSLAPDPGWRGLEVLGTRGGDDDATGVVEFVARHVDGDLRERSRFERRAGRWLYVDGDVDAG
ncbi:MULTISPECIES: YchJ family protein [unclassified Actinotalea]|uniref:YchJ family protein n=1 Tax=unclassified Actinotalea TaxID=2638618 RepID=UPI0015F5FFB5|nr:MULTISPECIES: YchJ family metal-binding protein [unclassified Actinotalea]